MYEYNESGAMDASSNDGRGTMNGQTETVRLKVCSNLHTTRQIVNAARVQRATYNQAIEWQVNAGRALDADALKVILDNETAKGNPRVKNGDGNWQYGGLVRASSRFRGWMGSPNSMRTDGQVPYESTKRAECQGRVRCQAVRGITITNEGTLQIAGVGELEVVGGVRPRAPESVREVSIQETNTDTREGPSDPDGEREFVVLITFNVEQPQNHGRGYESTLRRRRQLNPTTVGGITQGEM